MPSYTFVSTANAFVLRGAKIVFVDICKDTMNIDVDEIESAINKKTKAIVPVHYAGVACDMTKIMFLAEKYGLWVIEDAAQGVMSSYKGKALGSIGHIGCFSFHETKNYTSGGEGGAILINTPALVERAEVIREKGTNRSQFLHGMVDKYSWVDVGSSFLPSELQAAFLYAQLQKAELINETRLKLWDLYYQELKEFVPLENLPSLPSGLQHNAHMFYIKLKDNSQRLGFIQYMKNNGVVTPFHYVPLHSSEAGTRFGKFHREDRFTTKESERLVRLPMYFNLDRDTAKSIVCKIKDGGFF